MNSFNQQALGQFANYANCQQPGSQVYQQQPQSSGTPANSSLAAMQQFATQSAAASNFVTFQHSYNSVNCLQKEIESLKKQNNELQTEVEKLRAAYTDCNYQMMTSQMKQGNLQEQIEQLHKEKLEQDKAYKELKLKYDEKFAIFRSPHQSDERSLFCDQCNFEVKSQVALFIHKLNHHFEASIPRHLQLSTRSFSTMPDDNIRFKYKCHCCEIDSEREFARHEIYVHIYQFHTFDTPFKCKFCFLYFTSKSYLNDHLVEKHSLPGGRNKNNKRKSNANEPAIINTNSNSSGKPPGTMSSGFDQLNSGLTMKGRQSLSQPTNTPTSVVKRTKSMANSEHETNDINELFKQLVGETLNDDSGQQQQQQQQQPNNELLSTLPNQAVSPAIAKANAAADAKQQQQAAQSQRESEIQQIMLDLDGDDGLNCKYPGCKFVATNKNHLKFHISAHLMSKYKCPYCTFVGNRVIEIKRHILKSTKHTDQHVFLCPDCDFASDCEKTFRDHYSRYHHSGVDLSLVIERMFLNESNKVGQNMLANAAAAAANNQNNNNNNNSASTGNNNNNQTGNNNNNPGQQGTGASNQQQQPTTTIVQAGGKH